MKVAWFSPFNVESAIARYSKIILNELCSMVEIALFLPEHAVLEEQLETKANVIFYNNDTLLPLLNTYEICIFNIGDSAYHHSVWEALCIAYDNLWPTIVIMHDWFTFNLFHGYYASKNNREKLFELSEQYYGKGKGKKLREILKNHGTWKECLDFPFYEGVLAKTDLVIVNSKYSAKKIKSFGKKIEVFFIPSAYCQLNSEKITLIPKEQLNIPFDKKILTTIGVGSPNKLVDKVLLAIGSDSFLKENCAYFFVGDISKEYKMQLKEIAGKHRFKNLYFHGYASQSELYSFLVYTDVCINLRQPCIEGASATLVEALVHGKPTCVSDDGCYADLPDDIVFKIRPGYEVEDLKEKLKNVLGDPELLTRISFAAKEYIKHWDLNIYCKKMIELFCETRYEFGILSQIRQTSEYLVNEFNMLKQKYDAPIVRKTLSALREILNSNVMRNRNVSGY